MSDTPNIFHLITRLTSGGAVTTLTQLVTNLDGYDITVGYGAAFDQRCVDRLHDAGIETVQFSLMRHYNPITALGAVGSVSRYLKKNDFDIVHTHSTEAGIIGRTGAHLAGVSNIVHTIHGVPFTEDRNGLLNWFVEKCEIATASWTDVTISIADTITEEYLSRGIGTAEQYQTIYCGINVDKFRNSPPAENLPGSGLRILMVSRLARGKGFNVLLNALQSFNTDNISVLIAGDGPIREELESKIYNRGLTEDVFLLGYRDDVSNLMAASDIFVLPSFREGTPLVIYEAMASGLPIVATDIAGIPEQIDHGTNGFLIQPGDSDALASYLERLVTSPVLRNELANASLTRINRFSIEEMVSSIDSVYKNQLALSNSTSSVS